MVNGSNAPCYNCGDRKIYCHSKCDKYSDWKARKEDDGLSAERSYSEYARMKQCRISRSMQRQNRVE